MLSQKNKTHTVETAQYRVIRLDTYAKFKCSRNSKTYTNKEQLHTFKQYLNKLQLIEVDIK